MAIVRTAVAASSCGRIELAAVVVAVNLISAPGVGADAYQALTGVVAIAEQPAQVRIVAAVESKPLTQQFRAKAVSWRAFCNTLAPFGLTHIASNADAASLTGTVVLMHSPQTLKVPPQASITAWVMFWLRRFSGLAKACVPQNPGVRQIPSLQIFTCLQHAGALISQVSSVQALPSSQKLGSSQDVLSRTQLPSPSQ